ncbi:MAG TPA: hypothetical protein PLU22_02535 [Polyangiaceae bacterium]|nr:hypothetical protein [Polyangiaceae bacterium]
MRTLHDLPFVLEAARHGTLLGLLALVALVVELMLLAIALRRGWLARHARRVPSSRRPRRWPEVLGAAALLPVPLAGLVAAEAERQRTGPRCTHVSASTWPSSLFQPVSLAETTICEATLVSVPCGVRTAISESVPCASDAE